MCRHSSFLHFHDLDYVWLRYFHAKIAQIIWNYTKLKARKLFANCLKLFHTYIILVEIFTFPFSKKDDNININSEAVLKTENQKMKEEIRQQKI